MWAFIFLLPLLGAAFVVLSALENYSRGQLEKYCAARNPKRLDEIVDRDEEMTFAIRSWFWLLLAGLLVSAWMSGPAVPEASTLLMWLPVVWIVLVGMEFWIGRPIGEQFAEPILFHSWPILNAFYTPMLPVLWVSRGVRAFFDRIYRQTDEERVAELQEEILDVVGEGERDGSIEGDAAEMIEGLFELHEGDAVDIMTPRTDTVMLKENTTLEEAAKLINESGHSRIPVFGKSKDEILGILYAKDLLPYLNPSLRRPKHIGHLRLRKPLFVPEAKPINLLLREFQQKRMHIAIVLDEYGGLSGVITIEDILEEIVGEIADEHDEVEDPPVHRIDDNTFEVDGRIEIEELNELTGLKLPEDGEFDTIGGFVFSTLGRVPKAGERFENNGAAFTIKQASNRMVERIRIELVKEAPATEPGG